MKFIQSRIQDPEFRIQTETANYCNPSRLQSNVESEPRKRNSGERKGLPAGSYTKNSPIRQMLAGWFRPRYTSESRPKLWITAIQADCNQPSTQNHVKEIQKEERLTSGYDDHARNTRRWGKRGRTIAVAWDLNAKNLNLLFLKTTAHHHTQ
jgi:hypothetical protein